MKKTKQFISIILIIAISLSVSACKVPFLTTHNGTSIIPDGATAETLDDVINTVIDCMSKNEEQINIYHKSDESANAEDIVTAIPGLYNITLSSVKVFGGYNYSITYSCWDNFALSYAIKNNNRSYLTEKQNQLLDKFYDIYNSTVSPSNSLYENELAIHDYLVKNIAYTEGITSDHAYNALFNGEAVCSGYTECFKTFMDILGVECTSLSGISNDENHIWNEVKLDGDWYHVDVTWDDPTEEYGKIEHFFFNLTDRDISIDHQFSTDNTNYRPAVSTKYSYLNMSDIKKINSQDELDSYIEQCMYDNQTYAEFYSELDLSVDSAAFWRTDSPYSSFAFMKEPRNNYILYSILFLQK